MNRRTLLLTLCLISSAIAVIEAQNIFPSTEESVKTSKNQYSSDTIRISGRKRSLNSHKVNTKASYSIMIEEVADGADGKGLPAHIRVKVLLQAANRSRINIAVWMPKDDWNGRFIGTGNGGGAGHIDHGALEAGIRHGFAVANTDMGTYPNVDSLTLKPEAWTDFGYRATHEMTVVAKDLIKSYYGLSPRFSYFIGCSTGGQQALMTAQRYPDDYNGILAGAPANNRTHLHAMFLWNYKLGLEGLHLTRKQVESLSLLVILENRGKDGGYSGDDFLTDPRLAVFDPEKLFTETRYSFFPIRNLTTTTSSSDYNSDQLDNLINIAQIQLLKKMYSGPVNPRTGEQIYTSMPLGSESAGGGLFDQSGEGVRYHLYPFRWVYGLDFDSKNFATSEDKDRLNAENFDLSKDLNNVNAINFDFADDLQRVDSILAPILNANDPNLNAMKVSGGKIIMYSGLADPLVPPQDAIHYYERVIESLGGSLESTQTFFRFFLVPGMHHCGGGPGPCHIGQGISSLTEDSEHNIFRSLVKWVEEGIAPEQIIGSAYDGNGALRFRRPIYPYPLFPHYIEGENPHLPTSYKGVAHERGKVAIPLTR